jgi:hypothetical protein
MGKTRPPRRRKADALKSEPVIEPPKHEVVVQRAAPAMAPLVVQLVDALRTVAERMLDIADAAAEAVTKRLPGRT